MLTPVSGATISSNAIKKAVADALRKAGSKQKAKISIAKNDVSKRQIAEELMQEEHFPLQIRT